MAFTLHARGDFSLAAAAAFAESFPGTQTDRPGDELGFAWAVDDDWRTVRTHLRQTGAVVRGELDGTAPADLERGACVDAERILSLDVDGSGFAALGEREPIVRRLQGRFPGLRPVLFFTPYEAAAWAIIGQRIRMTQAAAIKQRLATERGAQGAFPAPDRLAELGSPQRGLTERKVAQLRALGAAALDGQLSRDRLRAMAREDAMRELQRLPGIGPFSAELILIRGVGHPDALPRYEPRLARATCAAYDLPDHADIEPIARAWRPYRAWVSLLLRSWLEAETSEIARGRRTDDRPVLGSFEP